MELKEMAPTAKSGRKSFMEYALNRFEKSYGQFYKSYDAFLEHFNSGEIKTPFPDMVQIVSDFISQDAEYLIQNPIVNSNIHLENIRNIEGIYYAYCEMMDITHLVFITGSDEVWFENLNDNKQSEHFTRSYLESIPITALTTICVNAMKSMDCTDTSLPSRHKIGEMARLIIPQESNHEVVDVTAYIRAVHFFTGKVKYDIEVYSLHGKTRLYNVDSVFLMKWNDELDTENSVVDFLKSKGMSWKFESREKMWKMWFPDMAPYWEYRGTEQQNIILLARLK